MTQERLNDEYHALIKLLGLSDREFKFKDFNTDSPYLLVTQMTNSGIVYTIKIELSGFPNNVPDVYITNPKPLRTRSGESMLEANSSMYTLGEKDGCVRVSFYDPQDWSPNVSLYQIVLKIRVWLEIYEEHLVTGKPLDYYLVGSESAVKKYELAKDVVLILTEDGTMVAEPKSQADEMVSEELKHEQHPKKYHSYGKYIDLATGEWVDVIGSNTSKDKHKEGFYDARTIK